MILIFIYLFYQLFNALYYLYSFTHYLSILVSNILYSLSIYCSFYYLIQLSTFYYFKI